MSGKRRRILTCTDAAQPAVRHELVAQISDLLTLAHPDTQLNQVVAVLLEQCPTLGLESVKQWADTKRLSSEAIRESKWSRHLPWPMFDKIFAYLQVCELMRAEWVCKKWRAASAQRGLGWSRDITLIKGSILERQLKAPRQPTIARIVKHAHQDTSLTASFLTNFLGLQTMVLKSGSGWNAQDMAHLRYFPNLTTLEWSGSQVSAESLQHIGHLTKLSTLTLTDEAVETPSTEFGPVAKRLASLPLTRLQLEGFAFSNTSLGPIFESCPLQKLTLYDGDLDPQCISGTILSKSTTLVELELDHVLPNTLSSPSLTKLTLAHVRFRHNSKLDFVARFPRLTVLALSWCTISASALHSISRIPLKELELKGPNFDTAVQLESTAFSTLETCVVEENHRNASRTAILGFISAAAQLPRLTSAGIHITRGIPSLAMLRQPQKLQALAISVLTSAQVRELSALGNLKATIACILLGCSQTLTWADVKLFQSWPQLAIIKVQTPTQDFDCRCQPNARECIQKYFPPPPTS